MRERSKRVSALCVGVGVFQLYLAAISVMGLAWMALVFPEEALVLIAARLSEVPGMPAEVVWSYEHFYLVSVIWGGFCMATGVAALVAWRRVAWRRVAWARVVLMGCLVGQVAAYLLAPVITVRALFAILPPETTMWFRALFIGGLGGAVAVQSLMFAAVQGWLLYELTRAEVREEFGWARLPDA
ncbi:MAG: hypothetical protein J0L64_15445 [Acidobacteria bacterium]|nr:hypothetical protein [Acidobacteriota bacterium]